MVIGTLVRDSSRDTAQFIDQTIGIDVAKNDKPEANIQDKIPGQKIGPQFLYKKYNSNSFYAPNDYLDPLNINQIVDIFAPVSNISDQEYNKEITSIWETPKFIELLSQPLGAPIELTPEEAEMIVRLAAGRRPDLPEGKDFVREFRELLGHSLFKRLEKSE